MLFIEYWLNENCYVKGVKKFMFLVFKFNNIVFNWFMIYVIWKENVFVMELYKLVCFKFYFLYILLGNVYGVWNFVCFLFCVFFFKILFLLRDVDILSGIYILVVYLFMIYFKWFLCWVFKVLEYIRGNEFFFIWEEMKVIG